MIALPAPFRKKGVKPQVLQVIEAEAREEKARLLADVSAILGSLGLASRAPPVAKARQAELFCDPDFELAGPADDFTEPPSD